MNNLIRKIKTKILRNKNTIIFVAFLILLFSVDNAFAADPTPADWSDVVKWVNWMMSVVTSGLGLMTGLVMKFLEPGWTSGTVFWLNDMLKNIWVMISNIVYFVFAFLLISIAFMNIIGHWDNNYQIKTALPKLIVWIIIVPFTWFIVQFIVSISSVLTASVIQLPYDVFKGSDTQTSILQKVEIPKVCTVDMSATWSWVTCDKNNVTTLDKMMNSKDSIWWIVAFYSFWLINIWHLTQVTSDQLSGGKTWAWIKSIFDLWLKVIVDITFVIAYLILLWAIALALFTRWIYLWLYTMFSPIFWLMYFFGKSLPSWMKKLEILTIPKLIWLAFVPVYVAAALSFWFIFLISAWHWLSWFTQDNDGAKTWWATTGSWFNIAGIQFNIVWANNKRDSAWSEWTTALSILWRGWDLVWQFLIQLFGIAILWMVVMAALWSSSITESIVKPIADFGTSIWKTVSKLPQYAPIFPGWSAVWLWQAWNTLSSAIDQKYTTQWSKFGQDLAKKFWLQENEQLKKITDVQNKSWAYANTTQWQADYFKDILKAQWDVSKLSSDQLWKITESIQKMDKYKTDESFRKEVDDSLKWKEKDKVQYIQSLWKIYKKIWHTDAKELDQYDEIVDYSKSWEISSDSNTDKPRTNWNTTININNIENIHNEKLTDSNWHIIAWKEKDLAEYLSKDARKFDEQTINSMFNWWDVKWLIKELTSKWYFTEITKEEKANP